MALGLMQGGSARLPLAILRLKCVWVGLYDRIGEGRPPPNAVKRKSGCVAPSMLFTTLHSVASWIYRSRACWPSDLTPLSEIDGGCRRGKLNNPDDTKGEESHIESL